jgi:Golgi nucleoside diphosphatase
MKKIIDFYDYVYFGLCNSIFSKLERVEKITSALAAITAIEWLYIFSATLLYYRGAGASVDWAVLNSRIYLLAIIVCAFNMSYMYSRHEIIQNKFSNRDVNWVEKYSFFVFLFYGIPIFIFLYLLLSNK